MDTLYGWISEIRDMGGIKFIILRNRRNLYQITLPKKKVSEELFSYVDSLNKEDVIRDLGLSTHGGL